MITEAPQALADNVLDEELSRGLLYPGVHRLREVTRDVAIRVAARAIGEGVAQAKVGNITQAVEEAMWEPVYPSY